jgi:hypothetical protein
MQMEEVRGDSSSCLICQCFSIGTTPRIVLPKLFGKYAKPPIALAALSFAGGPRNEGQFAISAKQNERSESHVMENRLALVSDPSQ